MTRFKSYARFIVFVVILLLVHKNKMAHKSSEGWFGFYIILKSWFTNVDISDYSI